MTLQQASPGTPADFSGWFDISALQQTAEEPAALLAAFKECQEGRCSCPTQVYEKVESLIVEQFPAGIMLSVKAKQGQSIDVGEIEKCLEHTENCIKR